MSEAVEQVFDLARTRAGCVEVFSKFKLSMKNLLRSVPNQYEICPDQLLLIWQLLAGCNSSRASWTAPERQEKASDASARNSKKYYSRQAPGPPAGLVRRLHDHRNPL